MRLQADFQAEFAHSLFAGDLPSGLGQDGGRRFAVYRNNVVHGLSKGLAGRYPAVESLLGAESFAAVARAFVAAHPPKSPMIFAWGDDFPDYLDALPALTAYPFLGDVARLEWARGLAWHAADAVPVPAHDLLTAAGQAETLRLGLHPSAQVLTTRHAAFSIWAAHQPGGSLAGLNPMQAETTLVLRASDLQIVTEPLTLADAAMLMALIQGETLLAALAKAGPDHDPTPLILRLVQHGAITTLIKE